VDASVFIATSLDGFIARPDGSLDWLTGAEPESGAEAADETGTEPADDYGFGALMASVDALVMGRNSFDFVLGTGMWVYGDTPVVVLTHRELVLPDGFPGRVEVSAASPEELAAELAGRGIDSVYVDGGATIQSFLRAGLVRRIIITRLPILIGSGIPLFGALEADIHLTLVRSDSFDNGFTQVEYAVG
jgi:dihydrofolate reductase